jgi:nucleoside-diphosphate kinase
MAAESSAKDKEVAPALIKPDCTMVAKSSANDKESTLAYIKPDGMTPEKRMLVYLEIARSGLKIINECHMTIRGGHVGELYSEHRLRSHFAGLVVHTCSAPVHIMELEGRDAVATWRKCVERLRACHATDGVGLSPDGLPRELGPRNLVHGSDSPAAAKRELTIFFG